MSHNTTNEASTTILPITTPSERQICDQFIFDSDVVDDGCIFDWCTYDWYIFDWYNGRLIPDPKLIIQNASSATTLDAQHQQLTAMSGSNKATQLSLASALQETLKAL